jgi:trans-feruloyl-CoA hydratase/vanillin synthase
MARELDELLVRLNADPLVKLLVLTGAGTSFCAGMDLKEFFRELEKQPAALSAELETVRNALWYRLESFGKPTIAMVNGHCFGGGLMPVAACDIAVASDEAKFGASEINWGHLPGGLVGKILADRMGLRQALYYAMSGEPFDGRRAEQLGLVTRAVPADALWQTVKDIANGLLEKSPVALRLTKELVRGVAGMSIDEAFEYIQAKSDQLRYLDREGVRAQGIRSFIDEKKYKPGETAAPGSRDK